VEKRITISLGCLVAVCCSGCLSYSHYGYSKRAKAARVLSGGVTARPGRIYFASFPENCLGASILGWHPNIGHASLVTSDHGRTIKQYDYGCFVGVTSRGTIGYDGGDSCYGVVKRKIFSVAQSAAAMTDLEIARMILKNMPHYGNKIELWAKDVDDIGIAERYMEQFAADKDRGSMAWRCWQIGGYRCGNIARQAFDAARGEGHFLDLLWGGFPGADAPSIGTEKTVYSRE